MARTPKKTPRKSAREKELEQQLAQMQQAIALGAIGASRASGMPGRSISELWVGVRNISDLTIGVRSPFPNEMDLSLHADFGQGDPGSVAVISYAWWLQLRKNKLVAQGLIIRDDRVLGDTFSPGPMDRDEDLPATAKACQILDPVAWIEERTEQEVREGIEAIVGTAGLYRLRRAVDDRLRTLQAPYPLDDPDRATKAYRQLPAVYQMVDTLTSQRLSDTLS